MKVEACAVDLHSHACDLAVFCGWKGNEQLEDTAGRVDPALQEVCSELLAAGGFTGEIGEAVVIYTRGAIGAPRMLLVGLGTAEALDLEKLREIGGVIARKANELRVRSIAVVSPEVQETSVCPRSAVEALTTGMLLGFYKYPKNSNELGDRSPWQLEELALLAEQEELQAVADGAKIGRCIAEAASFVRTWINHPSNIATADALEAEIQGMTHRLGLNFTALDCAALEREDMGLLLAVGQGARQPPRVLIVEHRPETVSDPSVGPVVLIGKGILFDSGGYSLKSPESMRGMNTDMAGSAVVLGTLQLVAKIDLPLHVIGIAPIVENLVGREAYKPSDVFFAKNGKSVEIRSTDAEGRLILADSLCYADKLAPSLVVDVATLTGAKTVALGQRTSALFCGDDPLCESLLRAGQKAGEPMWRMPLYPEYDRQLESRVADLTNSGGRSAGSVTAARFLSNFVGAWPWAHIDFSSVYRDEPEFTPRSYLSPGASDVPLRTLVEFLRERTLRQDEPASEE